MAQTKGSLAASGYVTEAEKVKNRECNRKTDLECHFRLHSFPGDYLTTQNSPGEGPSVSPAMDTDLLSLKISGTQPQMSSPARGSSPPRGRLEILQLLGAVTMALQGRVHTGIMC